MNTNTYMNTFLFFNDTATTEIYTLSLHDALPILAMSETLFDKTLVNTFIKIIAAYPCGTIVKLSTNDYGIVLKQNPSFPLRDRKSTRLNSSHANISYAVFCLKKKKS